MKTVMQMTVIGFATFAFCGAAVAGAPLAEFETPAMPTHPPATWLTYHLAHPGPSGAVPGDPNPAFYYKGRYHLHYIYNHKKAAGDTYAGWQVSFAHVSSTDMVHWKWHPTTLTPRTTGHGMFSGTGFFTKEGQPAMIYHGQDSGRNQIAFALDDNLEKWSKPIAIEPLAASGEIPQMNHWDPDCWLRDGTYYALSGGGNPKLMKSQDLKKWLYLGELFHEGFPADLGVSKGEDVSCPNMFKIGDKWMLLCISHGLGARYYLGEFRDDKYLPDRHALLNWARWDFFAPESLLTKDGRRVMWAWCTPLILDVQKTGRKKNFDTLLDKAVFQQGIQSLPRELSLPKDGMLRIKPLRELETLRQDQKRERNITVKSDTIRLLHDIKGDTLEMEVVIASPKASEFGINLLCDEKGENGFAIAFGAGSKTLTVDYITPPFELKANEDLTLRIFIDKSMIEVFANDRQAAVAWHEYPPDRLNVSLFARGGDLVVRQVTAWKMKSIFGGECVFKTQDETISEKTVKGLTGKVRDVTVRAPAPTSMPPISAVERTEDIDLQRMAQWAMNYLIRSPRKQFDYEPVFQANPMNCPPFPGGHDVVVACDTDARMDWQWYYMREISGSTAGKDIEAAFHKRMLAYVRADGTVLSHPGCYNEGDIHRVYTEKDYVYHVWGATKILNSLAEDFRRTGNEGSKETARKIMRRLKRLAVYPSPDRCYFPAGMGAMKQDGTPVPNGWNRMPAPVVEPLINYYQACGDLEALEFAKAYAEGIMTGAQPDGIKIKADGDIDNGHSHTTMHALWGIAHLGVVTGDERYTAFAKRSWDFMLSRGTGAGWFPAMPGGHPTDETCLTSDMMSNAAMIARGGHPEYFDYVERYLRNRISPCQFVVTPEFEAEYRMVNRACGEVKIRQGLEDVRKLQGGIRSCCGLNDLENSILKGTYHGLAGCCAPEGMRAIYTTWSHVIDRYPASKLGPAGVYVNMSFNRDSKWGRVVSFMPKTGRLTVKAGVQDDFFLRPPHWAPRDQVKAFVGSQAITVQWSGDYVRFTNIKIGDELTIIYPLLGFLHEAGGIWKNGLPGVNVTYEWLGNMVVAVDPPAAKTPIFSPEVRILPPPPAEVMEK